MATSLPGSRILQAVYLQAVLNRVARSLAKETGTTSGPLADLEPGDLPLVREDLHDILREWTGHDYAATATALQAEILADAGPQISALGQGRARWFVEFCEDERVARFLGVNEHDGTTWLNREALESLLTGLTVAAVTAAEPPTLQTLLDGRAIISEAADQAGYSLTKIRKLLTGK
jgi:hypothetical protein